MNCLSIYFKLRQSKEKLLPRNTRHWKQKKMDRHICVCEMVMGKCDIFAVDALSKYLLYYISGDVQMMILKPRKLLRK
jgi:hypothetical protein